jgi:hypothetical protein
MPYSILSSLLNLLKIHVKKEENYPTGSFLGVNKQGYSG